MATYNQRLVGEGDALAEEVRCLLLSLRAAQLRSVRSQPGCLVPGSVQTEPVSQRAAPVQVKSIQKAMKEAWTKAEEADDPEALEELAAAQATFRGHGPGGDL